MNTRVTITLDEADHKQVAALASEYRVSIAWVVRYAVADFLERHRGEQLQLALNLPGARRSRRE
jgi:predicted transcriptional regulator